MGKGWQMRGGGIRRRLMFWGLGLIGSALGLNTIATTIYTRRHIEQSTAALQSEIAVVTARHIQTYISRKLERLSDVASSMVLHSFGSGEQALLAHLLLKNDRSFTEVYVLDDEGQERLRIAERKVYLAADLNNQKGAAPFEAAMQGRSYISPVYTSDRAEPYVLLGVPLQSALGTKAGALVAMTNLKFLWDVVREQKFGRAGYVYVINELGDLIAYQDSSLVLQRRDITRLPKIHDYLSTRAADRAPGKLGRGLVGEDVLSTYAPVPDLGWAVVVEEPVAFARADLEKFEWFTKILLAGGLLLGTCVTVFVSNRITRPILKLRRSAEIIGNGNLDHRVAIATGDEIAELGTKFNQMADALKTSYVTLEDKVELRTRELSFLFDVTTAVNQSLVIDAVLNDVIKKITERFRFDRTRIYLFDGVSDTLAVRATYNTDQSFGGAVRPLRKGHSVVGRVAELGEPAFFEDITVDQRYQTWSERRASRSIGLRFLAALPIKTKTRTFGVATFGGRDPRRLDEQEIRLLNAMCEHVAVAIEKSMLFEEVSSRSEELSRKNQELKEALRVKSEFVGSMSHELRTPLNVILGYAKITEEGILGEVNVEQKDAQQRIGRHAEVLLKMVNDLLSLSRVEAKALSLDIGTVYMDELIAEVKGQAEQLRRDKPIEFHWEVDDSTPPLRTDPLKLEEILQNLIGNAIKFTPAGSISIRVRDVAECSRVEFSVADTGIGIEEDELERIFNAFQQGKGAHTGDLEGVGLGLSIVKKYLVLLQGEIRVASQVGEGATFTFTIPYCLEDTATLAA
jgi:signal transduction histidine kinase/HAMP domain-containing protein